MNSGKPATISRLAGRYLRVLDLKMSCRALSASVRWTKTKKSVVLQQKIGWCAAALNYKKNVPLDGLPGRQNHPQNQPSCAVPGS